MAQPTYIHGTGSEEQERLALLNRLTNQSFIEFLDLTDPRSILEIGSGLGILAAEVAAHHPKTDVWGIESATQQLEIAKNSSDRISTSFKPMRIILLSAPHNLMSSIVVTFWSMSLTRFAFSMKPTES